MGQIAGLKGGTSVLPSARVLLLVTALLRLSDAASAVGRLSEALVQWRAGRAVTDPVSGIAVFLPRSSTSARKPFLSNGVYIGPIFHLMSSIGRNAQGPMDRPHFFFSFELSYPSRP